MFMLALKWYPVCFSWNQTRSNQIDSLADIKSLFYVDWLFGFAHHLLGRSPQRRSLTAREVNENGTICGRAWVTGEGGRTPVAVLSEYHRPAIEKAECTRCSRPAQNEPFRPVYRPWMMRPGRPGLARFADFTPAAFRLAPYNKTGIGRPSAQT